MERGSKKPRKPWKGLRDAADGVETGEQNLREAINILEGTETATIEGGPITDANNNPLENVPVRLEDGPSTSTDANGEFELSAPVGTYTLIIGQGEDAHEETVELTDAGQTTTVEGIQLQAQNDDGGSGDGNGPSSGQILPSGVLTAGMVLSVLAVVLGLAIAGAGAMTHSRDGEPLELDALDLTLSIENFKSTGKTVLYFAVSGIAIGFAGYVSIGWVLQTFQGVPLLNDLSQLTGLLILFLVAPALAVAHGLSEGKTDWSRENIVLTAAGSLIGAVILIVLGTLIIGAATTTETPVGPMDAVAIAGLVGTVSMLGALIGMVITNRPNLAT
ncbi:MAG: carboxypeptidase-like regulatory domain-containing protein [Natrialbaceae archaeon]|nr:carboxypeptidase-like regulatory domain-containing protein [Natrialbaceae archaeon]